ncbi:MAG: hypothetical protein WAP52_04565, partial [Candidatus Sungiibacteriota bacterium]
MRIKNLFKNRLFYLNVALVLLLGVMVAAPRIGASQLPTFIRQAFAAFGPIQGDGTVGRIAKASGANTLVDSIMSESGSVITVDGQLTTSQVNTNAIQGSLTGNGNIGIAA